MPAEWKTFATDAELGAAAGALIAAKISNANKAGRRFVLGCPAGRSPLSTYRALAQQASSLQLDLSKLHFVLMDEFIERDGAGWRLCDADAHYSCRRFAEHEIRLRLNEGVVAPKHAPPENLHVPDPSSPQALDQLIETLGGIDLFLLASGTTDGHVAFNPPGTPVTSKTRIIRLADETRADNVATFPAFGRIDAVPEYGVSVGLGTIAERSRHALLLLSGAHKRKSVATIRAFGRFDESWPASVIFACAEARIFTDRAANPDD